MKISSKGLSKTFVDSQVLFNDINFELKSGDLKVLMGPSGCGKSVFLKCFLGLIPSDKGNTFLNGELLTPTQYPLFRSKIQYLGQMPLQESGTVSEIIQRPLTFGVNKGKPFRKKECESLLALCKRDLSFLNKKFFMLSGGEGQLVKILRSYNLDPEMYFFDEITSAMDEELKFYVESLIFELVKNGKGVFLITHDINQAKRLSSSAFTFPSFRLENFLSL